MSFWSWGA